MSSDRSVWVMYDTRLLCAHDGSCGKHSSYMKDPSVPYFWIVLWMMLCLRKVLQGPRWLWSGILVKDAEVWRSEWISKFWNCDHTWSWSRYIGEEQTLSFKGTGGLEPMVALACFSLVVCSVFCCLSFSLSFFPVVCLGCIICNLVWI